MATEAQDLPQATEIRQASRLATYRGRRSRRPRGRFCDCASPHAAARGPVPAGSRGVFAGMQALAEDLRASRWLSTSRRALPRTLTSVHAAPDLR